MIGEFFIKLVKRAKEVAKALRARCIALAKKLLPTGLTKKYPTTALVPKTVHAMKVARRYRLTGDHSPVFSLYTFFADSQ